MIRFYVYKLIEANLPEDESYRLLGEFLCENDDDAREIAEFFDVAISPYYVLDADFVDEGFTTNER